MSTPLPEHALDWLPSREKEIAEIVIRLGEASAVDVTRNLRGPPTNSAVRSMLGRLERKGVIARRRLGKRYLYRAALTGETIRRAFLMRIAKEHYGGSLKALASEAQRIVPTVHEDSARG